MSTFYLGLSMAGTVSAGTYTAGTLVEINKWLSAWQKARTEGAIVEVINDIGPYKKKQKIIFTKEEIPKHFVKIKTLTGTSGGGVNACLFLSGLTTGKVDTLLKDRWLYFDVMQLLNNDDLEEGKPFHSLLNVKPIDDLVKEMKKEKFPAVNVASQLDYIADDIEVFLTLASYAGVAYQVTPSGGNKVSYGVHKTHLDYIKFNFSKNGKPPAHNPKLPYAYNLIYNANQTFGSDNNWEQFMDSCPATGAFPIGFRPRQLKRFRNEYNGKLYYLDYTNPKEAFEVRYADLQPFWKPTTGNDDPFTMTYIDGGTFNREPHDLARASILQTLDLGTRIEHDGIKTNACVILIDPFASNSDKPLKPGQVDEDDKFPTQLPSLFKQPGYIIGAMMDQGRFRPDWIEKAVNDHYYSRYLISPIRRDSNRNPEKLPLAAGLLSAFSGFFDKSFMEHDYQLGHYNTCQFLKTNFTVPKNNIIVDYYVNADAVLKEKYEAVGWYNAEDGHCQVIPRIAEFNDLNSKQPEWPAMTAERWQTVRAAAMERAKKLEDVATDLPWYADWLVDQAIWRKFLENAVVKFLDQVEKELKDNKLLK
jgi:hypothetical protein